MSVLIKGMKMPKGCYECPLTDGEYGDCKVGATGEYDPYRKDCPLEEPKTGKWLYKESDHGKCSECGAWVFELYPFCPNCGADMRGEEE